MLDGLDHRSARALLEWQVELGVTEAIGEAPVNRYDLPAAAPAAEPAAPAPPSTPAPPSGADGTDPVAAARSAAQAAGDLDALAAAVAAYGFCDLRRGARNTVFADGRSGARVMIIGEAPGREEDVQGRPFVGPAGQLLDRMFAAIDMGRDASDMEMALYITNMLPWRPPENRRPTSEECAMMLPFLERHVDLAAPEILVLMGNTPCAALLGRSGITRLRGGWTRVLDRPALPMFHPAYLLRNPAAKREAWADLLSLKARLKEGP